MIKRKLQNSNISKDRPDSGKKPVIQEPDARGRRVGEVYVPRKESQNHKGAVLSWTPEYHDNIEILNLSSRSAKALKNSGITTVEKLLDLSYQSLFTIKNVGKKSVEELLACQKKLMDYGLQKKGGHEQNDVVSLHNSIADLNMSVRSTKALNNYGIDTIEKFFELQDQELYTIKNIGKKSIEEILTRRNNLRKTAAYKDAFKLHNQQEQLKRLRESFSRIPETRLNKSFHDYLSCFNGLDALITEFNIIPESIDTINNLPSIFELICQDEEKSRDLLRFFDILTFDIKKALNDIVEKIALKPKYKRVLGVLQKRVDGKTLQEISGKMGLTRERIRQIENKGTKLLIKYLCEFNLNLLTFINIEYNCGNIITLDELNDHLKEVEHLDFFIYILRTRQIWSGYTFHKRLNLFYNNTVITDIDAALDRIFALPDIIEEDKKDDTILQISQEGVFPLKIIIIAFSNTYKRSGKVYFKAKLSLSRIYDYILGKYYPEGIKLFDDNVIEHFKKRIIEVFGGSRTPENNRAIYAGVAKQAVLCDRGTYIHPKHIVINQEIIAEIDAFIAASPRKVISFNELFETFREKLLLASNINNRYFLQGVLNIYLGKKYFFTRDTISKEHDANFTDEIESYIKSRGEVHKAEVFSEFNGISQVVFSMRTKNNKRIIYIGNGWYMHAGELKIEQNDDKLKGIIEGYVKKNPVSSRKMLELLRKAHPRFLTNNAIKTHEKLFGILNFMFGDDFYFSRPYIAKFGTDEISNKTVIRDYLQSFDSITIQELIELCEEHHLKYFSLRGLIKNLNDDFLRVDSETLVRMNEEIDENIIVETAKLLLEKIESYGFIAASKMDDYVSFPKIDFEWNSFLLRSIVEKYMDDMIGIIDIPTTDIYVMNSIFIDPQTETDGYESLLRNILADENNNRSFEAGGEIIDWLKEQGLIIGSVPKCLLDESILPKDKYGKLAVKQHAGA
jgi:hypothetical protein